jgi:hypothetical protein
MVVAIDANILLVTGYGNAALVGARIMQSKRHL